MLEKIIDIAKQDLDVYDAELVALLALNGGAQKWELLTAQKRLQKLADAIDKVLGEEEC